MLRFVALCAVLVMALACHAGAVTVYIDTFNGAWESGPIGQLPTPDGAMAGVTTWVYFGYGAPCQTLQETGLTQAPHTGTDSALRINVPGGITQTGQFVAINMNSSQRITKFAHPDFPIDFTKPIYIKADVYGVDYGSGTKFESRIQTTGLSRTEEFVEWGDNGTANGEWVTLTTTIDPDQDFANLKTKIYLTTFFENGAGFPATNAIIWDNLRMEYTSTVPEPGSLFVMATGLVGLTGIIRRRK